MHSSHRCFNPPKDKTRILVLKDNLTEEDAFKHEVYMIGIFKRKCDGGILHNKTLGGEGSTGAVRSEEFKRRLSEYHTGRKNTKQHNENMSKGLKGVNSKTYELIFDDGRSIIVKGLKPWAKENGYDYGCLSRVRNGHYKQHKGIIQINKV